MSNYNCRVWIRMFEKIISDLEKYKSHLSSEQFLVVDIGTNEMKVMQIKRKRTEYSILKTFLIPEMSKFYKGKDIINMSGIVENLIHIIQVDNIKVKTIYVTFSSYKLQSKVVKIPDVPEKEMKTFVEIEYQKQFPNYSRVSDVIDYMPLGKYKKEETTSNMVLMSLLPIAEASSLVKEFQKKKLFVKVIDSDVHLLTNLGKLKSNDTINRAVIDIGYDSSQIIVMKGTTTVFSRQIQYGIFHLIKTLMSEEDVSIIDSERIVKEIGLKTSEDILVKGYQSITIERYNEIIEQSLSTAFNDIYRSTQFVSTTLGVDVNEVILVGGISNLHGAAELCASFLDVPTNAWCMEVGEKIELQNGCSIKNNTNSKINGSHGLTFGMAVRGTFL